MCSLVTGVQTCSLPIYTALSLARDVTLEKYGVELIGADAEAIDKAEDRLKFRDAMDKIGLESPRSAIAHSIDEALAALEHRSEEHTSELQSLMRISYAVFCLKKKKNQHLNKHNIYFDLHDKKTDT